MSSYIKFNEAIEEIFHWINLDFGTIEGMLTNISIRNPKADVLNEKYVNLFRKFEGEFRKAMYSVLKNSFREHHLSFAKYEKYKKINIYLGTISKYFAFYLIWIRLNDILYTHEEINKLLESVALGTLGYRILDLHFDEGKLSNQEVIIGLELVQKHERILFDVFGFTNSNFNLIYQSKMDYFKIEIKEKKLKGVRSPYSFDKPIECGYKSAPAFSLFALALNKIGRYNSVETYKDIFYDIMATIQIVDDLYDLKDDLSNQMFTLPASGIENNLKALSPNKAAQIIYKNGERLALLHDACWKLLRHASKLAETIDDSLMMLFAEYRLSIIHKFFFSKEAFNEASKI